ncbi:hypothetical protein [Pengzhenrongella frigida]|uniref:Uncharacterized protein n=1 Tax=Pengzhenrongella frigida TaxID=1259133 RepID=A0A4Q5N5X9_9MICO|nr:hypothetical protein [Cellulomonas sp. HLT2-17]RYV52217.1 hypothetical protein EUA98_04410 [Cellulomonas sp. HLT2-17]
MTVLGLDAWRAGVGDTRHTPSLTVDDVVDALASVPSGDVLLIAGGAQTAHAARIALSTLRRSDVALVEVSGSPTRRHAVRLGLDLLWPDAYGCADVVLAAVDAECSTQALVSSVTRLSDPNPRLTDHVASWFPGQFFAVDVDAGEIVRTRIPELLLPTGEFAVLASQWSRPEGPEIAPLPNARVELAGPPRSAPWQAKQWVEVTVMRSPIVDTVQRALAASQPRGCPSCARAVTGAQCRFCGIVVAASTRGTPIPTVVFEPSHSEETYA